MLTKTRASAPDGTGDSRRTVGAGELVDFFPQTLPNVLDLAGTPANWTATAGTPASATGVPVFTWAAPEAAGNVTIIATLTGSAQSVSTTITTLGPSAITAEKTSEDSIPAGTEGAGMRLKLRYMPLSVNFDRTLELEDPEPATNVSGYFQKLMQAGVDLSHHPNPNWTQLNGNSVTDHAFVHAPPLTNPPAWEQGHFDWRIPNRYLALVPGAGVAGPGTVFTTTSQTFDMLGTDGTIMITKQNATVVRSPSGLSGVRALQAPTAPGDYPTPGNPLDLPQTRNAAPSASGRTI